jgi:hypothetical protein
MIQAMTARKRPDAPYTGINTARKRLETTKAVASRVQKDPPWVKL